MSEEGMLMRNLLDRLDKPKTALGASTTSPPAPSVPISDDELRALWLQTKTQYPQLVDMVPKHTDAQLAEFINGRIKPLDPETMVRAIKIVRYG